jgi:DNA-binding NarL/FixJ family response regulator
MRNAYVGEKPLWTPTRRERDDGSVGGHNARGSHDEDVASPLEPGDDDEVRLTPHRREMLIRLFAGETPHEIALALGRSTSTVTNTIATIRRRLGVRRDVDALREALRRRIVTLEEVERRHRELRP